ncbi:L-fuco-beta-pyranose dehydrogenase [Rhodococcus aetherivorans]|uniref:L-fuco-beta-pyranose dehydrogenase n=1 Tax=Rhodococcus aetherivorans TaxID=191292 RepID=A0ABQ0YHN6_9NOCA|nr:SDR family oxidoreductase [Rhodococcus aetherivorans]ETT28782.1 short-chain dehydrogenase/reductase SDR [Rhodococcus rhodochrous ATCC 21198]KDE11553.1 dehydrogenase [Rhodococcus aetherivorans]NGP29638.1 SDR family oxidoreductase [Rhodococcus aetherivorans]GES36016.1 L-fuco-beta-pyranose dehydrogenase [Rhodococcus aetherivorans]
MHPRNDPPWLQGAGIVVTGAGNGIGRALAHRLARAGARVVVNDLDPHACMAVAEEVGGYAVPGDAAAESAVHDLVVQARQAIGSIDVFFANAGIETGANDAEPAWDRSWNVNVMAHVRALRELLPEWLGQGKGRFVVTASAAGLLTMLGSGPYSVTKHAAVAHAEWVSATYGDRGITVQCLCPQGVRTQMLPTNEVGDVVFGKGVLEANQVADEVLNALGDDRFYILPHPQVAQYYAMRATEPDRWLQGMRRLQRKIDNAASTRAAQPNAPMTDETTGPKS